MVQSSANKDFEVHGCRIDCEAGRASVEVEPASLGDYSAASRVGSGAGAAEFAADLRYLGTVRVDCAACLAFV